MKTLFLLLSIFTVTNSIAQVNMNLSNEAQQSSVVSNVVEIVTIDQMPLPLPPGERERMLKSSHSIAMDGFSIVEKSPEAVKSFFSHFNTARTYIARQAIENQKNSDKSEITTPEIHKDLSTLKTRFKPKSLSGATLIAAAPNGTKINDNWTGLEQFFQIKGVGMVRLSEDDLGATGGKFYMIKDFVNTRVHGHPAISRIFTDDDGQIIEEIAWGEAGKFYMLTFGPDIVPGNKSKAAVYITAHSLAQELF